MPLTELNLEGTIGFNGNVRNAMICTVIAGEDHVVYPLGNNIVIRNVGTKQQSFLQGHMGPVDCIAVCADRGWLASGDRSISNSKFGEIKIWDLEAAVRNRNSPNRDGELLTTLALHKKHTRSLSFSHDGKYLASGGGKDDNSLVVWSMDKLQELGSNASRLQLSVSGLPISTKGMVMTVQFLPGLTNGLYHICCAGESLLQVHSFNGDCLGRAVEAKMPPFDRTWTCIAFYDGGRGTSMFCGNISGDVCRFKVVMNGDEAHATFDYKIEQGNARDFGGGVQSIQIVPAPQFFEERGDIFSLFVGGGGGQIRVMSPRVKGYAGPDKDLLIEYTEQLQGGVTSIAPVQSSTDQRDFWCGTKQGHMYRVRLSQDGQITTKLMSTAHYSKITSLCFPKNCSELLITAGGDNIRIWNVTIRAELLRICIQGARCLCVDITDDGQLILAGFEDGTVRGFLPESGKLAFCETNVSRGGVTDIKAFHGPPQPNNIGEPEWKFITAGGDNRVRLWTISSGPKLPVVRMQFSAKEHGRPVTSITISADNKYATTSSHDGSCIVWSLDGKGMGKRHNAWFHNSQFAAVVAHPDQSQYLTVGTDRHVSYVDDADCTEIRRLVGSEEGHTGGSLTAVDIEQVDREDLKFVTGADEPAGGLVKCWSYDEGECIGVGIAHSATINGVKISPDGQRIVSVGDDCAINIWAVPGYETQ